MHLEALFPCFIVSYIGDYAATSIWGVHRSQYIACFPDVTLPTILKFVFAAVLFGLASRGGTDTVRHCD
ncbi:hypothetical protein [Paenibacillus sp. OSY-SE]|uniref:hypothetical protein n=1 Tax=Paenibacillus sp. OSY-SE TaxID=1196323 RepID=UPI0002DF13B0|nr:hypothetical protein [Paenibacillus sp. OSY-SE]